MTGTAIVHPADVARVLEELGSGEYVQSADYVASQTGVPEKRVKEIHRALKALGFANFGVLCDVDRSDDRYVTRGSGYWLSGLGENLSSGISAARDAIAMAGRNTEEWSDRRRRRQRGPRRGIAQRR